MPASKGRTLKRKHSLATAPHGLILPSHVSKKVLVRNQVTGRVLPCCLDECDRDADDRYQLKTWHENPEAGRSSVLTYIFCKAEHRELYYAMMRPQLA